MFESFLRPSGIFYCQVVFCISRAKKKALSCSSKTKNMTVFDKFTNVLPEVHDRPFKVEFMLS